MFIASLLREFYTKAGGPYQIRFDYPSALEFVQGVIAKGYCLVGPTSCAGAVFVPFPFNRQAVLARVEFWYFKRPREITIFDTLREACRWLGATHIGAASHYPENTVGRVYDRRNMLPIESYHMGELTKTVASIRKGE